MNISFQHARPEMANSVDFVGSMIAASSIAVALILDRFIGWGESRWSVLDSNVVLVMLPVLAVWVVMTILEQVCGTGARILLIVHCIVAFVPSIALAVMAQQGKIFSSNVSALLEKKTTLTVDAFEIGLVAVATIMAIVACIHAVRLWKCARK